MEVILKSAEPDIEKRSCFDCKHCKAAVSWWCYNQEAVIHRGTALPTAFQCKYWEPVRTFKETTWWERFWKDFMYI